MLGTMFHSNHKREFVVIGLARDEITGQIAKAPAKRSVFSKNAFMGGGGGGVGDVKED